MSAQTDDEKSLVQETLQEHLGKVFADRDVASVWENLSEQSTQEGTNISSKEAVLYVALDGMDQVSVKGLGVS